MQGFVFNTRRPIFQDPRVRQALAYAFDFEWTQQEPLLRRLHAHQELLLELRARLERPAERRGADRSSSRSAGKRARRGVHEGVPAADDRRRGNIRDGVREALRLLGEAGWTVQGQKLVNAQAGEPMRVRDPARRARRGSASRCPSRRTWSASASTARVRVVDTAAVPVAHRRLRLRHDRRRVARSRSRPATSSATSGASQAADEPGSRNLAGIRDPVVDELIELVIAGARSRRASSPAPARSTACCSGATTSSPTGTSRPSASPTGTSSGGPPSRRSTRSASTPGGSTRRRRPPCPPQGRDRQVTAARADARLPRPPPPADRPDALRHHDRQLRHRAGRARRARRADDRPLARRQPCEATARGRRVRRRRDAARARGGPVGGAPRTRYRGARGIDPRAHPAAREASTASTSPRHERFLRMMRSYLVLRLRQELLPGPPRARADRSRSCRCRSRSACGRRCSSTSSRSRSASPRPCATARRSTCGRARVVIVGYAIPGFLFAILLIVLFAGGSFLAVVPAARPRLRRLARAVLAGAHRSTTSGTSCCRSTALVVGGFAGARPC